MLTVKTMSKTDLLRRFSPRIVDFHSCSAWPVERKRLGVPAEPTPSTVVTVRVERVPARAAHSLGREAREAGGQVWTAKSRDGGVEVVLRGCLEDLSKACSRSVDEPEGVRQVKDCVETVIEAYQRSNFTLRLKPGRLNLGQRTAIMGILNVTPDSFSDGGSFLAKETAVEHALAMCEDGADVLDIGGESTRPGAEAVTADEERRRVIPIIEALAGRIEQPISIDTSKAEVARDALAAGARIINDVTGLSGDPEMAGVAAESGAPVVLMHMRGSPRSMQRSPRYRDVISAIALYLRSRIHDVVAAGVAESQIVVDPGIGFGKTVSHNLEIMRRIHELRSLGRPMLIGASRKSFIGKVLDVPVDQRLWGTAATVGWAVAQGAHIVRVHDVVEAVRVARMTEAMMR